MSQIVAKTIRVRSRFRSFLMASASKKCEGAMTRLYPYLVKNGRPLAERSSM
jgi:hypothetical protein